jgi:hypothetical protein
MDTPKLQKVTWKDVRKDFCRLNPMVVEVIDTIDPGKDLPFIKVSYAFGEKILEDGKLSLLNQVEDDAELLDLLDYSPVPLGLFLNKSCEAFVESNDRFVPIFLQTAGNTVGLFETLDLLAGIKNDYLWSLHAGARSIFMLAKINNNLWHKRLLRHFDINTATPKVLTDQWEVFVDLANSSKADLDWRCDMVFFTKPWFEKLCKDKSFGWVKMREFLYWRSWFASNNIVDKSFSFFWQNFSSSTIARNYKPRIYITDTIRHVISIGHNWVPGFAPATDDLCAPVSFLKKAYHEIYDLPHTPTIIEPSYLQDGNKPVYYSLGYPTLLEGQPELTNIYNTISDLKEIRQLLRNMQQFCQKKLPGNNSLMRAIQQMQFDYFHKVPDKHGEIKQADSITSIDKNFLETDPIFNNKGFCASSPFLNGCIQIAKQAPALKQEPTTKQTPPKKKK